MYNHLKERLPEILKRERNFISNAANFASYLFKNLQEINWVGFYFLSGDELILGPFQGKPACTRIQLGKGVCGSAAKNHQTIIVSDVEKFPGHIPCDPSSKSEIVVPLVYQGDIIGVLDIDSKNLNRFNNFDKENLENLVNMLIKNSDVEWLKKVYAV